MPLSIYNKHLYWIVEELPPVTKSECMFVSDADGNPNSYSQVYQAPLHSGTP